MAQTKKKSNSNIEGRFEELEKKIADYNNLIELLLKDKVKSNDGDRDITFISLCNHTLNLSTEANGEGNIYTFSEFGEEQSIPYSDAKKIIKNNKSFIKGGKCYIADEDIIASEHLTNDYKKILNKENLLQVLSLDRSKFSTIFNSMTKIQKEILKDIVIEKIAKDKDSVDMNIVQFLNDELNINILDMVEYGKNIINSEE